MDLEFTTPNEKRKNKDRGIPYFYIFRENDLNV